METNFAEALTRLDADIARAEVRAREAEVALAELRLKRQGADAFLEYLHTSPRARTIPAPQPPPETGHASLVEQLMRGRTGEQSVDDVLQGLQDNGHEVTRHQVRNALHYLARKKVTENAGRRGWWRLRDSEAPVSAGASDGDRSHQGDRSWEEGGNGEGTVPPGAHDAHSAVEAEHRLHPDGASMKMEVTV